MGNDYGVDRSGWKQISDRSMGNLRTAKGKFHRFMLELNKDNLTAKKEKEEVVDFHLVGKCRTMFRKYVKSYSKNLDTRGRKAKVSGRRSAVYYTSIVYNSKGKEEYDTLIEQFNGLEEKEQRRRDDDLRRILLEYGDTVKTRGKRKRSEEEKEEDNEEPPMKKRKL